LGKAAAKAQERQCLCDDWNRVSSVPEGRGVQYFAEGAGAHGNVRCHVIRRQLVQDRSARYSIVVSNESDGDARALAFVPDDGVSERRTVVHTIVGPRSDFSTTVVLEITAAGMMPELRVALTSGDTQFTLEVPAARAELSGNERPAQLSLDSPSGGPANLARTVPAVLVEPFRPPYATVVETPPPPVVRNATADDRRSEPEPPGRAIPPITPFTPVVLLFAGLATILTYFVARPQISDIAVPGRAIPGTPVSVRYRVTGVGNADYTVIGPDGRTLANGPLTFGPGSFSFNLPPGSGSPAYLVRINAINMLGQATAEAYVSLATPTPSAVAEARPAPAQRRPAATPPPPQIRSLALDRATLASGETLTVYYDVAATGGSVVLLDPAAQITYGRSDLSPSGHATFVAPRVEGPRLLTVVATVQRGNATTQSRIGVTVTPPVASPPAVPPPLAAAPNAPVNGNGDELAGPPAMAEPSGDDPGATTIFAPATVRAGHPVRVDAHGRVEGLQIVLLDGTGRELEHHDLGSGEHSATFTAPDVRVPTRFIFEATYPHGVGSETIVRTIAVMP
jgi:hypothetical protein